MKPITRISVAALVALAAALVLMAHQLAPPAGAQIPQTFKNLKVLPEDIPRRALIDQMREVAGGLGVRCNYCHVGGNPETLEGVDFASDEKETKRVARAMMRMTKEINGRLLRETGRDSAKLYTVKCVTCHHRLTKPSTLHEELVTAHGKGGVDSSLARYRALRERYYGWSSFDFSEESLVYAASLVARQQRDPDGALALLRLNLDHFPKSFGTYGQMGEVHLMKGDTTAAVAAFEKLIELDPENAFAKRLVERLKKR